MRHYHNTRQQSGYTIMELLVVIGIFTFMVVAVSADFTKGRRSADLQMAAHKLASDARRMQSHALALENFDGSPPRGGWGIHFRPQNNFDNYYRLFADDNGDYFYDSGEEYQSDIYFPGKVYIDSIEVDGEPGGITGPRAGIVYEPPNPNIHLCHQNGSDCSANEFTVVLCGDMNCIEVIFNKFGLIDVGEIN